jgi:hypothetical protein
MLGVRHLHVLRREAATTVASKEGTVAAFQNVDLWEGKSWIVLGVGGAILGTDMASHQGSAMRRVFAVKDEQSSSRPRLLEELIREKILVVVVDSSFDVTSLVLVLETAVDDHFRVVMIGVFTVENLQQGLLLDARYRVGRVLRVEVREGKLVCLFDIHHCL